MASIDPPRIDYTPQISRKLIEDGRLSDAQLENIALAGASHSAELPDGRRQGFFIGDGTGVGKGREIAGILMDNWNQGRKKAVWISFNGSLINDAGRDMAGIGWNKKLLVDHAKVKATGAIGEKEGVLFSTYNTLARTGKAAEGQAALPTSRLDQIVQWLGPDFDGVIAFDEAHLMGNAVPIQGARGVKKPSLRALAGVALQFRLPKARIVYVSATGATEVSNLSYAERLGLWGAGTAFNTKTEFINQISAAGVAAMEMVARDLKALGLYMARSISYDGVTFERLEHKLSADQREVYDELAGAWQTVLANLNDALKISGQEKNGNAVSQARGQFWSTHQRFFGQVMTALQMPSVIDSLEKDLAAGKAPVIQIVTTGAAQTDRILADKAAEAQETGVEMDLETLDFTPRQALMDYLERGFPTQQYEEVTDLNGNVSSRPVVDSEGKPVQNAEAVAMRESLLKQLAQARVPDNPLDSIINHFGPDAVAEVTGRTRRVVKKKDKNGVERMVQESWNKVKGEADAEAFQGDKKKMLVFSQAGGTGKSYHADLSEKNQRKRQHYILQAGWRADAAVQGLGRTHRSNQAQPPHYLLVSTDLNAQKRFISTIAKRMEGLGALTKGQRDTTSQGLFSAADNLETDYAHDSVRSLFQDIAQGRVPGISEDDIKTWMGLALRDSKGNFNPDAANVKTFLNRLLNLKTPDMNRVWDEFFERLEARMEMARQRGELDTGMETIRALSAKVVQRETLHTDAKSGAKTEYQQVELTQKTQLLALDYLMRTGQKGDGFVRNKRSGQVWVNVGNRNATNRAGKVVPKAILRNIRGNFSDVDSWELSGYGENSRFEKLGAEEADPLLKKAIEDAQKTFTENVHMITGALLPIWNRLTGYGKIYRIGLDNGERLLGRQEDDSAINELLQDFHAAAQGAGYTPANIIAHLKENGGRVRLANGTAITLRRVYGHDRIEIQNLKIPEPELAPLGLQSERIGYEYRFFAPPDKADAVLTRIMLNNPVVEGMKTGQPSSLRAANPVRSRDGSLVPQDDVAASQSGVTPPKRPEEAGDIIAYHGGNGPRTDFTGSSSRGGLGDAYFTDSKRSAWRYALLGGVDPSLSLASYRRKQKRIAPSRNPHVTKVRLNIRNPLNLDRLTWEDIPEKLGWDKTLDTIGEWSAPTVEKWSDEYNDAVSRAEDDDKPSPPEYREWVKENWPRLSSDLSGGFAAEDTLSLKDNDPALFLASTGLLRDYAKAAGADGLVYSDAETDGFTYVPFDHAQIEVLSPNSRASSPDALFAATPTPTPAPEPPDEPTTPRGVAGMFASLREGAFGPEGVLSSAADDIQKMFAPDSRGEPARLTAEALQHVTAEMQRRKDLQHAALSGFQKIIARLPEARQKEVLFALDEKTPLADPGMEKALAGFRALDAERVEEFKKVFPEFGIEHWENFANYLRTEIPHLFKNPEAARLALEKRFQAGTGFLKHRNEIPWRELVEKMGLEPASWNAVDLIAARWWAQERFLGAQRLANMMVEAGTGHFEHTDYEPQPGEKEIGHRLLTRTVTEPDGKGGTTRRKLKFYAHEPAARIVENYLSEGLRGKAWFRGYLAAANRLNAAQLGLSAFHGGFVTVESITSALALALHQLVHGDFAGALKSIASAPIAPVLDWKMGKRLIGEWNKPGSESAATAQMLQHIISGGGRAGMDNIYHANDTQKFLDALRGSHVIPALLRAPYALIEQLARPIMEKYVPYLKMAGAAKLIAAELERNPNLSLMEARTVASNAVRSMNNRFGQMTYDNLHLHKTMKDILMGLTRSLGWNWGTFAEVGGGVAGFLRAARDIAPGFRVGGGGKGGGGKGGKPPARGFGFGGNDGADASVNLGPMHIFKGRTPEFSYKMAYVLALPIVAGILGTIINGLFNQKPETLKDLYFPKTGDFDSHGRPLRLSLPSYMKDVFAAARHPLETITNKLHPLLSTLGQMFQNRDFFGTEIRHADDRAMRQILDELKFAGKQFAPFTITNLLKTKEDGASLPVRALGFLGFGKAPASINETDAQQMMGDLVRARMPAGTRTHEQADHSQLKGALLNQARQGNRRPLVEAIQKRQVTPKEGIDLMRRVKLTPFQDQATRLNADDLARVMTVATPAERREIGPLLARKQAAARGGALAAR